MNCGCVRGSGTVKKQLSINCRRRKQSVFALFPSFFTVLLWLVPILLPDQIHTHRQRCSLGKGFQHRGGECCRHFPQHRTMVSAAVMITNTVTNPTVNQINSLMVAPSFPFDSLGDKRWSWTFEAAALPPPPKSHRCAMR